MLVELGNPAPASPVHGFNRPVPAVTMVSIPESYHPAGDLTDPDAGETHVPHYGVVGHNVGPDLVEELYGTPADTVDVELVREHYGEMRLNGVTRLPGSEALVSITHPLSGIVAVHGAAPSWVYSEDCPALAAQVAAFYGCPVGRPADLEDTHFTRFGPPGVGPLAHGPELTTLAVGIDFQWMQMFGGSALNGKAGTATASSATSLTTAAGNGTTAFVGGWVVCTTTGVYGNILSHTDTVLTLDRWYNPATPGGAAGTTPGATEKYVILPSGPPAFFLGLSANASAVVAASDTTLPGEITTASGGLIRKVCPVAHTLGTSTGTLTPVFTANGSDTLPVTIAKIGVSASILSTFSNRFNTLLGTTAVMSLSGDQLTITDTVTLS